MGRKWRGFVCRWLEDVVGGVVDDALDLLDLEAYGAFSDLGERVEELGERVDHLEGLGLEHAIAFLDLKVAGLERVDLDELSEQGAGLEVRVENCEAEGAIDRVRLSQVWDTLEGVLDCLEVIAAEWPERDGVRLRSVVTTAREVFGDE